MRTTARWSDLSTPKPGAVVNVATESDIEATVSSEVGLIHNSCWLSNLYRFDGLQNIACPSLHNQGVMHGPAGSRSTQGAL